MTTKTHTVSKTATAEKGAYAAMKDAHGYSNVMQAPKLSKVILSIGIGSINDKKRREYILEQMALIAGQRPSVQKAKKSIATFKVRTGDLAGYRVTLRGERMYSFLDKLIHIVLPRTRDFRGIDPKVIDDMGNATVGIKEHTVFPETSDADIKDMFGLGITIVTTAKSKPEAEAFLRLVGLPLRK